jgi:hypothetical protein
MTLFERFSHSIKLGWSYFFWLVAVVAVVVNVHHAVQYQQHQGTIYRDMQVCQCLEYDVNNLFSKLELSETLLSRPI